MSANLERLEARLAELRAERAALEVVVTKEDVVRNVDEWVKIARAHAAGASRIALAGQATGDDLAALLAEDRLADEGLAGRIVSRLEAQGFGELSDRAKKQQRARLDSAIAAAEKELLAARKQEALEQVEREFAAGAA